MGQREALRRAAEELLVAETGAASVRRLCPRCGSSDHGRPVAVGPAGRTPYVSISYAGGLAAVAWGWDGRVGIDIELDGQPVEGIDPLEWTAVEAAYKAGPGAPLVTMDLLPAGYVGTVAGNGVSWRLAGPEAPAAPAAPSG